MSAKVIQISLSEEEYKFLSKEAERKGVTVQILIKKKVLPKSEVDSVLEKIIEEIDKLATGEVFNIRKLFGDEWKTILLGKRLSLGRIFYKMVLHGGINNVEALPDKDSTGTQLYRKL